MNKKAFLVLVFPALVLNPIKPSRVTVSQGGYRNVLAALSDEIPESEAELVQSSLTKLFSAASARLKTATRDKLYFAELKVLVPQSWKMFPTESSNAEGWESFQKSDFRVTATPGDPYTVQDLGCGQQGRYVQLGKDFVIESDTDSAMTVVREWARYRYGVFEEDGTNRPEYPDFYYNPNGHWVVNMCNNTVVGLELKNCTVNTATSNNETCEVVVDPGQNTSLHSSIMTTFLHNHVDGFCDVNTHNSDAPNRQNVLCGQRSVWEILNKHNDFTSSSSIPPQNITPLVTFVKPHQARIFIHWDTSIVDNSQKDAFSNAVREFIAVDLAASRNILLAASNSNNPSSLVEPAIVTITNAEKTAYEVAKLFVSEQSTFGDLSNALQSVAKIWEDNSFTPMGSIVILISHRTDESLPLSETVAKLTDAGIKLHLITSEQKTVASLGPLALDTGGSIFLVSIPEDSLVKVEQKPLRCSQISYRVRINEALSAILNGVIVGSIDQVIEVYKEIHILGLGSSSTVQGTFTIDKSLTSTQTDFYVYKCLNIEITIELTTPSDSPYALTNPIPNELGYRESNLSEVGTWKYRISSANKVPNSLAVVLSSRREALIGNLTTYPIVVRGWVKTINNPNWPEVILLASVTRGSSPVSGVCVKAVIAAGNRSASEINLLDNGRADPDVASGDGIYSRYFTSKEILSGEVYQVEIVATGGTSCGGRSAEVFTRTYFAGTFEMPQGQWDTEDPYPPGRVTDLRIEKPLSDISGTVQIGWTATGEDLDEGSAFQYNVRCASDISELELNFDQLQVINLGQVNGQPTSSVESGVRVSATFAPGNSSDNLCAMKAVDKSGRTSALSNTVTIAMVANGTTDVTQPPPPPPSRERRYTRLQIIGISALSIACFIIALLLLIVIFMCLTRSKKEKVDKKDAKKKGKNQKSAVPPEDTIFDVPVRDIRSSGISHDFDPAGTGHYFGSVAGSTRDWDSDGDNRDDGRSEVGSDATHSLSWVPFKPDQLNRDYFAVRNEGTGPQHNITRYSRSRRRSSSPQSRVESFVGPQSQHPRPMSVPPKPPPKSNNAAQYPPALQLGVHNFAYNDSYDTASAGHQSNATRRTRREIQV